MRVKSAAMAVMLLALVVCLIPAPAAATSLTLNPTQGNVGSEVTIHSLCNYGTGEYSLYWGEAKQLLQKGVEDGCNSITFTVPEAARGKNKVLLKIGEDSFDAEFKVIPSISLDASEGAVDSELKITGRGFNARETGIEITYDSESVETGIAADSKGSWESVIKVPPGKFGEHIIGAGGTTPADEVDVRSFSVTPEIGISPISGWVGTMVTINGTGFDGGETGITVTYDGMAVKTAISSDSKGSWRSSFFVPASAKGRHRVDSYGQVTSEDDVAEYIFTVSPAIKLELDSSYLGDTIYAGDNIWVSGIGFEENESGIKVTFDGTMLSSGIVADANGSWAVQLGIPLSTGGEHKFDALGDTTKGEDVADAVLLVSPQIEINPTSGEIGAEVELKGEGFAGSQPLTVSYGGNQVATGAATDAKGSFTASFRIPPSKAGDHAITVADAEAFVASTSFNVESTSPPAPGLIAPETGSRSGFIGRTVVAFDWADVDDPSGVSYMLEIGQVGFSDTVLSKEGLTQSQYTLTEGEALAKGEYYWKVKAIDGAGNESGWATEKIFKIGLMEWWLLVLIVLGGVAVIAVAWRVIHVGRRGGWS